MRKNVRLADSLPDKFNTPKGSTFTFRLPANATTGYSWQVDIKDENILMLVSKYKPRDPEADGAGGVTVLTFSAPNKGKTTLILVYAQDWEGGDVGQTNVITITVE